ncbi:hypothetical protein BDW72DRAFT_207591 [Aspergillus terricola var. indicus]
MPTKRLKTINLGDHDDTKMHRAVLDRTEERYDEILEQFDMFVQTHYGAATPPDTKTYKRIHSLHGQMPVLFTLDTKRRYFDAALAFRRGRKEWMKKEHPKLINVPDLEMSRDSFSRDDLTIVLKHLWCYNVHEYRGKYAERSRIELSVSMLMYCFTLARTGEVHESTARRRRAREEADSDDKNLRAAIMAACYKHFHLSKEWVDGIVMLVLIYERNFVKGGFRKHRSELPIHGFYEKYAGEVPLFLNLLTFFFRSHLQTDVDKASLSPPTDDKVITFVEWKPEVKDVPLFRPYNEQEIIPLHRRARGADAFGKQFAALEHRAGYPDNINVRACRRWALMESARMKFAGQTKRDTFGKSYAHRVSEIDGAATFLEISSRRGHIKNHRSMGMRRNPSLYQSLPAKAEFEFVHREDISELDTQIQSLLILESRDRRVLHELKRVRSEQIRRLGSTSFHDQTFFLYARKVMPDRALLADVLPTAVDLRSPTGRKALSTLESICSQHYSVAYHSNISPINQKLFSNGVDAFAEFCFERDLWYNDRSKWREHCQHHLSPPQSLIRCDLITYRNALVRPGRCPFCLGNGLLDPTQRTKQYLDSRTWYKHVQSHFTEHWLLGENLYELYWHVEDPHYGKPPYRMKRALEA